MVRKKSTPKKEVDEFIKKSGVPRPPKQYEVNIEFEEVKQLSSKNIIEMREVSFSYKQGDNENKIFENWFISCPANNDVIKKWWLEVDKALTNYKDYVKNSPEKNLIDVERPYYLVCHLALKNIYENG